MFGYIRPNTPELRVKEHELYKAVYCGLCSAGGRKVSRLTRLGLSYDFVFLAMLRMCFTDETPVVKRISCPCFPIRRRNALSECPTLRYCAAAHAVLSYYKLCDDVSDSTGFARVKAAVLRAGAARAKARAIKMEPGLEKAVKPPLDELSELERSGEGCIDRVADKFATVVANVASLGFDGAAARILAQCGYHAGRFIYLADACDDLEEDAQHGRYNPLIASAGSAEAARSLVPVCVTSMNDSMNALLASFGLCVVPYDDEIRCAMKNIIENIAVFSSMTAEKRRTEGRRNKKTARQ